MKKLLSVVYILFLLVIEIYALNSNDYMTSIFNSPLIALTLPILFIIILFVPIIVIILLKNKIYNYNISKIYFIIIAIILIFVFTLSISYFVKINNDIKDMCISIENADKCKTLDELFTSIGATNNERSILKSLHSSNEVYNDHPINWINDLNDSNKNVIERITSWRDEYRYQFLKTITADFTGSFSSLNDYSRFLKKNNNAIEQYKNLFNKEGYISISFWYNYKVFAFTPLIELLSVIIIYAMFYKFKSKDFDLK